MTGKVELLDAPQVPAVRAEAPLPAEHVIQGGFVPTIRAAANSHVVIWTVILTIGPLGLPLIWISPKYSLWAKVLINVLTLGFTIVLPIALTIYCSQYLMEPLLEAVREANTTGGAL